MPIIIIIIRVAVVEPYKRHLFVKCSFHDLIIDNLMKNLVQFAPYKFHIVLCQFSSLYYRCDELYSVSFLKWRKTRLDLFSYLFIACFAIVFAVNIHSHSHLARVKWAVRSKKRAFLRRHTHPGRRIEIQKERAIDKERERGRAT